MRIKKRRMNMTATAPGARMWTPSLYQFEVRLNPCVTNDPCALCGARCDPTGLDVFLEGTQELVCDRCADLHCPNLQAERVRWHCAPSADAPGPQRSIPGEGAAIGLYLLGGEDKTFDLIQPYNRTVIMGSRGEDFAVCSWPVVVKVQAYVTPAQLAQHLRDLLASGLFIEVEPKVLYMRNYQAGSGGLEGKGDK